MFHLPLSSESAGVDVYSPNGVLLLAKDVLVEKIIKPAWN